MKLVICVDTDSRAARLKEFTSTAERVAIELEAELAYLHSGRALLELSDQCKSRSVDHLVICCHGGSEWLLHPARGVVIARTNTGPDQVTVAELAEAWSPVLTVEARISLAACLCLRSPESWQRRVLRRVWGPWSARSYQRGGEASFGARLRDEFALRSIAAWVRGHRSAGHLTRNPILAELGPLPGEKCVPLFERALPDQPLTIAAMRRWTLKPEKGGIVMGRRAERWLLFDDSVEREIRALWPRA